MRRQFARFFLLFSSFLPPLPAFSQETPAERPLVVDLDLALQLAEESDLELESALASAKIAREALLSSWLIILPSSASLSSLVPLGEPDRNLSSLSVTGSWSLSADLPYTIRGKQLLLKQVRADSRTARAAVRKSVKKNFFDLLFQEASIEVLRQSAKTSQERARRVQQAFEKGVKGEIDFLQAKVNAANQQRQLNSAVIAYRSSRRRFQESLGLDAERKIRLSGSIISSSEIPPVSSEDILARAASSPRFQKASLELSSAINSYWSFFLKVLLPSLSVNVSWGASAPINELSTWKSKRELTASLSLSIPLLNWVPFSASSLQRKAEKLKIAHLERSKTKTLRLVRLDIQRLLEDLEGRSSAVVALQEETSLARKRFGLVRSAYNQGTQSLRELEAAEELLLQKQLSALSEKNRFFSSLFELESLIGEPLEENRAP